MFASYCHTALTLQSHCMLLSIAVIVADGGVEAIMITVITVKIVTAGRVV